MVRLNAPLPALDADILSLYHTTDTQLGGSPILIFHGPSAVTNSTQISSRIQAHVFSSAGFRSYPRITANPNSDLYEAVNYLPRDQQGDNVKRGLAIALFKYYQETLTKNVKSRLLKSHSSLRGRDGRPQSPQFDAGRAGRLAGEMVMSENIVQVIQDLNTAFQAHFLSCVDVDVSLPQGSIKTDNVKDIEVNESAIVDEATLKYGDYSPIIEALGPPLFLPTSKLRRAPSRPTRLNRSKSLLGKEKAALRREMQELVDTEERYVTKLHDLVENVAEDFRSKAKTRATNSSSPTVTALNQLFPPSLNQILKVNSGFLADAQAILHGSELDAVKDAQVDDPEPGRATQPGISMKTSKDATGATAFAKVLLNWLPKFSGCYSDYMRASSQFPSLLTHFTKDSSSSFSRRVQQTGEQRLRSMLIEPVQRLPRYSLFIDNLTTLLPANHSALQTLLNSRDIIADICSLESSSSSELSQSTSRLKSLVSPWPSALNPQGRLIAAVDFYDVTVPPSRQQESNQTREGIFLLFPGCLIVIAKSPDSAMTAKGLSTEIERPNVETMIAARGGHLPKPEMSFLGWSVLEDVRFTECSQRHIVNMILLNSLRDSVTQRNSVGIQSYQLVGPYEGRTHKWIEEVCKATIQGRFSESERESGIWDVRSFNDPNLSLICAIFENGSRFSKYRGQPSQLNIQFNQSKLSDTTTTDFGASEISIAVKQIENGIFLVKSKGLHEQVSSDQCNLRDLRATLLNHISSLLSLHFITENPHLTHALMSYNSKVLRFIMAAPETDQRARGFRPPSPVKLISNFLSSGKGSVRLDDAAPALLPSRGVSQIESQRNPAQRLEDSFVSYVSAIRARKRNVVGRILRARPAADELSVNEVYNAFLENPPRAEAANDNSIDVLFAAFEKFLNNAWSEHMGSVISYQTLSAIQYQSDKLFTKDFDNYFKMTIGEIAPQNRRAFTSCIKLLSDLLDAAGNDGDRGILTATFSELLVRERDPHHFISLLDRLVEDFDRLFNEFSPISSAVNTPTSGSANSSLRARSTNNASSTPNNSLKKRFGFGGNLSRENSKTDPDSKVGALWRTLSKGTANPSVADRPISRDRPTVLGAFSFESPQQVPTQQRKKRRSSLSDLKDLQIGNATPVIASPGRTVLTNSSPSYGRENSPSIRNTATQGTFSKPQDEVMITERKPAPKSVENPTSPRKPKIPGPERSVEMQDTNVKKLRMLDDLYREVNAENEALYERFNLELEKMMKAVKIGKVEQELMGRLQQCQNELGICKKENARLKRENVGLKARLNL